MIAALDRLALLVIGELGASPHLTLRALGGTNRVADARDLDFCAARNTREFWQFALN
jgi:hypothetical protein